MRLFWSLRDPEGDDAVYNLSENEHQELFYRGVDLTKPMALHIPSPLGHLPYYLFIRVAPDVAGRCAGASFRFDLVGLHETHVTAKAGEGALSPADVPSLKAGLVWHCLCRAGLARGDGPMVVTGWPADLKKVDLLLCTWPRFVESGEADRWIEAQLDPLWAPSGVPLGAIGGGRVDICRDGRFRNFSMNNNQDAPLEYVDGLPGAYLAVEADGVIVDLASRPVVEGHKACRKLEFQPRFPQATLGAAQVHKGIDVSVTLSGTMCPHDLRRSSLPGFLVRWEVSNTGPEARTVTCRMGWPNLVGFGGRVGKPESFTGQGDGYYWQFEDATGRKESEWTNDVVRAVRFAGAPKAEFQMAAGQHLLGVLDVGVSKTDVTCGEGRGHVAAVLEVPAGGKASAIMGVIVDMPHWIDTLSVDRGRYHQNHFESGEDMLVALFREHGDIIREAGALAVSLDDSSLPDWLRRRLSNCTYPLVTNSVLYKDGRFSINEGPTEMSGCYGTIDQRLGAHAATQVLFPELNAMELTLFGKIQGPEGGIQHDLGGGNLERTPAEHSWPDLSCSFIIQTARHAWSTGDSAFEEAMWPRAKRALLRHARWAEEGKGVAQVGKGLGTSYDSYHYIGTTGYIGTLWLAALAVMEKWAGRKGDGDLIARIGPWRQAAVERLEKDLWNGSYYIAYGDQEGARRETCHAGQVAGQWFARMLAGVDVVPEERLQSSVASMLRLNGSRAFPLPPDEASADGKEASDFGWLPYVEAFMLTACAAVESASVWPLWKRMIRVMDDESHPCDTRLMYRPAQGELSWGAYYMTAPASWLVYDALIDFFYSAAEGVFRLGSAVPGKYPLVHPRFWGSARVHADGRVEVEVQRVFGEGPLTVSVLELAQDVKELEIEGRRVVPSGRQGRYDRYPLATAIPVVPGAVLSWKARRSGK